MDSYEGILEAAELAVTILREAAAVKILATSRARLSVKGENLIHIGGLSVLEESHVQELKDFDAVRLFLSAAQRVRSGYEPDDDNLAAIGRICRLVQGMPLGIILASAWLEMLSPAAILAEIENSLDFLSVDWLDLPKRQRSLRATLDYTWRLLDPGQKAIFRGLSIFRGGFTVEAASEIVNATPQDLLVFVDRSLIQPTTGDRYAIHDMVRQYAAEKLAESRESFDLVSRRHSAYFTGLLAQWSGALKDHRQQPALEIMDVEHANLSSACNWALLNHEIDRNDRVLVTLFRFYELRTRYREGEQLGRMAVEAIYPRQDHPGRDFNLMQLQIWLARFNRLLDDSADAELLRQKCIDLIGDLTLANRQERAAQAFLYLEIGQANYDTDREEAKQAFQESLRSYKRLGDDWGTATALVELAGVTRYLDELAEAVHLGEEGLALFRDVGDPRGIARALNGLGQSLNRIGRWDEGEGYVREMIDLYESIGDRAGMASGLLNLSRVYFWFGRFKQLNELANQSLVIQRDLGLRHDAAFALLLSSIANWLLGDYDQSKPLSVEALSLALEVDFPRIVGGSHWALGGAAIGQKDYIQAREHLMAAIHVMRDLKNLDDLAAAVATLSCAEINIGELDMARDHLVESLEIVADIRGIWGASYTLFLAREGMVERAIEVYTLIRQYPIAANSRFHEEVVGQEITVAAAALPPEVVTEAEERGREGDPYEMAALLLEELSQEVEQ
jgi:predicted ATPase